MVLRIFKIIATSGFPTVLECTPRSIAGLRGLLLRGRGRKGKRKKESTRRGETC